jgi:ribulose-phosphate 3-epimerase
MIEISPSIICANYLNLQKDLNAIVSSKATLLHLDIMDGSFVPQITIGSSFVQWCKKGLNNADIKLDVHLMVQNPEKHIDNFIAAGADIISFHHEATNEGLNIAKKFKDKVEIAVAIKPSSDINVLEQYIAEDAVKFILIMTVEPGLYGQPFLNESLHRISIVHSLIKKYNSNIKIIVDGGINNNTAIDCYLNGANIFVVGSYIFMNKEFDIKEAIDSFFVNK